MADIRFACPRCNQHITCDDLWGGHEIQCPSCQGSLTVPTRQPQASAPAAAAAPQPRAPSTFVPKPPAASKLALSQNAQQPAEPARNIPIRNLAPPPPPKTNVWLTMAKVAGVIIVLGVGAVLGWPYLSEKLQKKAGEKPAEVSKAPDSGVGGGGGGGPLAEANVGMDVAESLAGGGGGAPGPAPQAEPVPRAAPPVDSGATPAPKPKKSSGPTVAPAYTLEVASAKIPSSRVNGKISGTNFVAEMVRVDAAGATPVLRFVEGSLASPDREVLVYLRTKPGEKLEGQKLSVSKDMRGATVPQVAKRWKTNPRYAPQRKSYSTGYAMKLEFGKQSEGTISGKVYIALPDAEQSVIAGNFEAATSIPETGLEATSAPPAGNPMENSAERAAFEKRYGITPR